MNLSKEPAHLKLKIGDPWTFILDKPLVTNYGRILQRGDFIVWTFIGDETPRMFIVRSVQKWSTYECTFEGFMPPPEDVSATGDPMPPQDDPPLMMPVAMREVA